MPAAELFVTLLEAYAAAGLLFACAFLTVGIRQVDPASKGSGAGFRLIILPGVAALWPVMLGRWIRGKGQAT
jgi:hypothetical protein